MNKELAKQLAHQLLMDAPALSDTDFGIRDCGFCQQATWARAGQIARRIDMETLVSDAFRESKRSLPVFGDLEWPDAPELIEGWNETLTLAHSRHS